MKVIEDKESRRFVICSNDEMIITIYDEVDNPDKVNITLRGETVDYKTKEALVLILEHLIKDTKGVTNE